MNTKINQLVASIDSTVQLNKAIAKAESKKLDLVNHIETLKTKLEESANRDLDLRNDIMKLFAELYNKNLDYDLIVTCIAKNFNLPVPTTKIVKSNIELDSISEDIVDFVSQHSEGVPMKVLANKFSEHNKIKFATHVKSLVEENLISKQGERGTTKYFPSINS